MKIVKPTVARIKRPLVADADRQSILSAPPTALTTILAARTLLHDQIHQSAQNGKVADALPRSLYANYLSELAAIRQQLAEEAQRYQADLARLEAKFPEPPPAAPEPPAPPVPRVFPRMGKLLGQRQLASSGARP